MVLRVALVILTAAAVLTPAAVSSGIILLAG
jgi:hypothetical protein